MIDFQPLTGLTAAPFTPFHPDGTLNLAPIPGYARFLQANGVNAAFVCGTTGEGPSMTTEERLQVAGEWARFKNENLRLVVHVGHNSLPDAVRLADHAREIGAHAVSALAPYFFKPATVRDLVDWCIPVAAAAAPLPFYFYHIPSFTGVSFPVADFITEARSLMPTLAGVKFTFEDLADYEKCLSLDSGYFDVLFGRDEMLLKALKLGARGAVGSTYNYSAPLYLRLKEAFKNGDMKLAESLQQKSIRMIEICNSTGVTHLTASKTLMAQLGIDCGPVRSPLRKATAEQTTLLWQKLKEIEFPSFACRSLG
jgi:N-acetylneuraminate lyase